MKMHRTLGLHKALACLIVHMRLEITLKCTGSMVTDFNIVDILDFGGSDLPNALTPSEAMSDSDGPEECDQ